MKISRELFDNAPPTLPAGTFSKDFGEYVRKLGKRVVADMSMRIRNEAISMLTGEKEIESEVKEKKDGEKTRK